MSGHSVNVRAIDGAGRLCQRRLCRGCERPILWALLPVENGPPKRIPLDTTPATYEVTGFDDDGTPIVRRANAYVSHFATCPQANQFSGERRAQPRKATT